jgi:choline transport protein
MLSVYVGAITGFNFLIAVCFCIGEINVVTYSTTGVPLIQIYFDSTGSLVASCILATLIVIIDIAVDKKSEFFPGEGSKYR